MQEFSPAALAPLFVLPLLPLFWCGLCWLLAQLGGWARLARRYASYQTPRGTPLRWQSARIGWVNYNNVLHVDAAHDGLFLSLPWLFRVGHPALFLPWSEIHDVHERRVLWLRWVRFDVGLPPLARLQLPTRVFAASEAGRARLAQSR